MPRGQLGGVLQSSHPTKVTPQNQIGAVRPLQGSIVANLRGFSNRRSKASQKLSGIVHVFCHDPKHPPANLVHAFPPICIVSDPIRILEVLRALIFDRNFEVGISEVGMQHSPNHWNLTVHHGLRKPRTNDHQSQFALLA